jgi:bacterioferritin-associated ferredoxin
MYVCICNALSERKIRESANQNGPVRAVGDIFRALGAEPECGKCAAHAVAVYHEEAARHAACA